MSSANALTAFQAFVASASGNAAIFAQQIKADVPRPALPYITLDITADVALSATPNETYPAQTAPETDVDSLRTYSRRATVRLTWYGTGGVDGLVSLRDALRKALDKTSPAQTLRLAGFKARPASDSILDTTGLRDTANEPAAAQDWHLFYTASFTHEVPVVNTINLEYEFEETGDE